MTEKEEDDYEEMVDDIAAIEASLAAAASDGLTDDAAQPESDVEITPAAVNLEEDSE
ncbi:hypothetical protein ACVBE9_10785 [Eionea flava]